MNKRKSRTHSEEFKQEPVRLALESEKPKTQVA
jgi:transposase-like protein